MLSDSTANPAEAPAAAPATARRWGSVRHVTNGADEVRAYLEQAAESNALAVVNWSMSTCGPCQRVKPAYEQMARSRPGTLFVVVDLQASDANANLVEEVRTGAYPTFHLYRSMYRVHETVGSNMANLADSIRLHTRREAMTSPAAPETLPSTAEMQARIVAALTRLRASTANLDVFVTATKQLLKFVDDVLKNPKYRRVNAFHFGYLAKLERYDGGTAAMEAFGFRQGVMFDTDVLVMSDAAANHPGLPIMKTLLEQAIPASTGPEPMSMEEKLVEELRSMEDGEGGGGAPPPPPPGA